MTDDASTPFVASRAACLAGIGIVAAVAVVALAPQQWPVIASILATEALPLVAWLLAAFGFGRLCGTGIPACDAGDDVVDRHPTPTGMSVPHLSLITRVAIGLGVISLLTLLLGSVGFLNRPTAVGLIALGDLLAIAHIYKHRKIAADSLGGRAGGGWLLLLLGSVVAITLIGTCVLPGVLWGLDDPSGYDVVAYHLQMPREWFDLGRITTLPHNVFSFFPLNVEMHYLLAMHLRGGPWAGMYLSQLMHGSFIALTVLAVYAATRDRGRLAACAAAIVCASVPWMPMLGSVAYNEGGLMLYATLAVAWAIRGQWGLAGACAGLAAGSKLTGVTSAIVLVPVVIGLVRVAWRASLRDAGAVPSKRQGLPPFSLVAFVVLALLAFSPWLIRTAIASGGNPIFPLAAHTLGSAHFDAGQIERFEVAHSARDDQRSLAGRATALWQQVGGDYHFGAIDFGIALPLWLALIVPAIILARRDREAWIWLSLIVGNTLIWLFATHLQGRFLVQIVPCVAMLVGCAIRPLEGGSLCRLGGTEGPAERHGVTPSRLFAAIAIAASVASFVGVMRKPLSILLKSPGPLNAIGAERPEDLRQLLPEPVAAAVYDSGRPIVLVGDAKAFWYAIPSARFRYRSVFDVPSTKSFRDAWLGDAPDDALVIVDPGELARFAKTYRNLPAMPEAWRGRTEAFVIRVADVPR